jgi:hypothetical protein
MTDAFSTSPSWGDLDADTFYRHVLEVLGASGVPFLVGGAYAYACFTGIERYTKDLDLFIRRQDYERTRDVLLAAGYETDLAYPHWLAKVHAGDSFVDLIFSSGNAIAEVDDGWFRHARDGEVLGVPVRMTPVEETIWSKAFIMERERYDGADIVHLVHAQASRLDWQRLLRRFGPHWRVLLSHLVLFGFIYPAERGLVPAWVMDRLLERLHQEARAPAPPDKLCAGTLLSREQYLHDIEQLGYRDARLIPLGNMTVNDAVEWTDAIPDRQKPQPPDS